MGGSHSIIKANTDRSDYARGETVTGTLYLHLIKEVTCNGVDIMFVGCERVKFVRRERYETKNSDGSSSSGHRDVPHSRHEVFLNLAVDALSQYGGQSRTTTLAAGNYEFPFRINLPMDLPNEFFLSSTRPYGDIQHFSVKRRYKVKCRCRVAGFLKSDLRHKLSISIRPCMQLPNGQMVTLTNSGQPSNFNFNQPPQPQSPFSNHNNNSQPAYSLNSGQPSNFNSYYEPQHGKGGGGFSEVEPILYGNSGNNGSNGGYSNQQAGATSSSTAAVLLSGGVTAAAAAAVNFIAHVYVCCCCNAGTIVMKASAVTSYWVLNGPGVVSFDLRNTSNTPFDEMEVRLVRTMSLNGTMHEETLSTDSHVLSLGPGESVQNVQSQFNTSCASPAPSADGRIFRCSYAVVAKCKTSGCCKRAQELHFPVTILPQPGFTYGDMHSGIGGTGAAMMGAQSGMTVMSMQTVEPTAPPPDWCAQQYPEVIVQGVPVVDGIPTAIVVGG